MASERETPGEGRAGKVTIFVSDPSAEAEQIAVALRTHGYAVVDVPLAMLVARVAVQRPRIVVVDADAEGAYGAVFRMRELPEVDSVDVLFLGRSSEPVSEAIEDAGSFFARPVDIPALLRRIETLTSEDVQANPSMPVSITAKNSVRPNATALPPPSMRTRSSASPAVVPSTRASQPPPSGGTGPRRSMGTGLSNELIALLAEAEERAQAHAQLDSNPPSPEDEIEAVLPTELLAALDEPLEEPEEEEEEESDRGHHTTSSGGAGRKSTTGASSRPDIGGAREITSEAPIDRVQAATVPPPRRDSSAPGSASAHSTAARGAAALTRAGGERVERHSSVPPPETTASPALVLSQTLSSEALLQHLHGAHLRGVGGSEEDSPRGERETASPTPAPAQAAYGGAQTPSPQAASLLPGHLASAESAGLEDADRDRLGSSMPRVTAAEAAANATAGAGAPPVGAEAVLGVGDAVDIIARAIATRVTGSLSFEADGGLRRAIVREGDIVTSASSLPEESLLAFLESRGDLPKERSEALTGRVPAFGRHAGAALVAHGVLRQDQLWPVLRAHAEWILGRIFGISKGIFVREGEAPGRLKGEPSVFGGSTGAEVFVDVARRVTPAQEAVTRLGGPSSAFANGPNEALLVECALDERETHLVRGSLGRKLEEVLAAEGLEAAPLLYALRVLGVLSTVRSLPGVKGAPLAAAPDPIDEDAIRAKIEARLALVDEGDYFAILGVPRSATGYEIRRAFLELRRGFEPARMLTPNLVHLTPELTKITSVLEEAYDILRDDARRDRYRRAIEANPIEE